MPCGSSIIPEPGLSGSSLLLLAEAVAISQAQHCQRWGVGAAQPGPGPEQLSREDLGPL